MAKMKHSRVRSAAADTTAVHGKPALADPAKRTSQPIQGVGRIASYRKRKRAVEKGIDDAIRAGLSAAFTQAVSVVADVNPNASSVQFIYTFNRRLRQHLEARESAVQS